MKTLQRHFSENKVFYSTLLVIIPVFLIAQQNGGITQNNISIESFETQTNQTSTVVMRIIKTIFQVIIGAGLVFVGYKAINKQEQSKEAIGGLILGIVFYVIFEYFF